MRSLFLVKAPTCSARATNVASPFSKGEGEGEGHHYCPSGVVTSVPDGGLNSNVDEGIAARV